MNLYLETTTGKLNPAGEPARLARGGVQALSLQFLASNVATLLLDGSPIALKLYDPSDLDTPILSVTEWTEDADNIRYTALLDTLAGALAWVQQKTYLARIDYNDPNVSSGYFHLEYGGTAAAASPEPTRVVNQITTVGKFFVPLMRTGKLSISGGKAVFGYYRVEAAGRILGAQLIAEEAPDGDDIQVDLINAASEEQNKVATLTDGQNSERTIYGAPIIVAPGDIFRCKLIQVGSNKPGAFLKVNLICDNE